MSSTCVCFHELSQVLSPAERKQGRDCDLTHTTQQVTEPPGTPYCAVRSPLLTAFSCHESDSALYPIQRVGSSVRAPNLCCFRTPIAASAAMFDLSRTHKTIALYVQATFRRVPHTLTPAPLSRSREKGTGRGRIISRTNSPHVFYNWLRRVLSPNWCSFWKIIRRAYNAR